MFGDLFGRAGLSLDRLRSFLIVAEAGAIARAAPGNPTRQSQLSRQIGELEEFFGLALVERRGRGIALTAAGERLAVVVREALQGISEVATSAEEERVATATLGAGDSFLHAWVIPRIGAALERSPNASVTLLALSSEGVIAYLLEARLDFGIIRSGEVPAGLRARPLGTVEYALYVPRGLVPRARSRSAEDLLGSIPLAAQYGDPELNERIDASLRRARVTIAPKLVCATFPQAQRAVLSKRFGAILPTTARADLPAKEFDEIRSPIFGKHATKVLFAWHPRLERHRPRVAALVPELVSALTLQPVTGRSGRAP